MKKPFLLFIALVFSPMTYANQSTQSVPEFAGGLKVSLIKYCEKLYKAQCKVSNPKSPMDGFYQQDSCVKKEMPKNKSCVQASKIRELTGYAPTKIKKYGPVTVFYTSTLADGVDQYYMVDIKGQMMSLFTHFNLSSNRNYQALKKTYPDLSLRNALYWTKVNEDLFPKSIILPNNNQELVFKQALQTGNCVACMKTRGVADVAYIFDANGTYLNSKILKITPLEN